MNAKNLLDVVILEGKKYTNMELILLELGGVNTNLEKENFPHELWKNKEVVKTFVELGMLMLIGYSRTCILNKARLNKARSFKLTLLEDEPFNYLKGNSVLSEIVQFMPIFSHDYYFREGRDYQIDREFFADKKMERFENRVKHDTFFYTAQISVALKYKKKLLKLIIENPEDSKTLMSLLSLETLYESKKILDYDFWKSISKVHKKYNPGEYTDEKLDGLEDILINSDIEKHKYFQDLLSFFSDRPSEKLLTHINHILRESNIYERLDFFKEIQKTVKGIESEVFFGYDDFLKETEVVSQVETKTFKVSSSAIRKLGESGKGKDLKGFFASIESTVRELQSDNKDEYLQSILGTVLVSNGDVYIVAKGMKSENQENYVESLIDVLISEVYLGEKKVESGELISLINESFLKKVIPEKDMNKKFKKF